MLDPAQLVIYADAQIGMTCSNFNWSTVKFIGHHQGIPFMDNMHDIVFINVKFHLPLGFPVKKSGFVPFVYHLTVHFALFVNCLVVSIVLFCCHLTDSFVLFAYYPIVAFVLFLVYHYLGFVLFIIWLYFFAVYHLAVGFVLFVI